jgi:micrococcal nuclease
VTVSRVVDGDTIEISPAVEGVSEVRLIGVDTPETKDPNEEVEPFGPEASEFATSALQGQEIGVERSVVLPRPFLPGRFRYKNGT